MGILPMRRRAILALQFLLFLKVDILVKRTAKMAVPLFIHVLRGRRLCQCLLAEFSVLILLCGAFRAVGSELPG